MKSNSLRPEPERFVTIATLLSMMMMAVAMSRTF